MTTPDSVTVQLLGDVSLRSGDRVVDPRAVGGPRCADALAYLTVYRHRDVSMTELAAMIWTGTRPQSWNATLRNVISKVRDTLEAVAVPGESIRSRQGYVRFLPPDTVAVDLEIVRQHARMSLQPARVRADRARVAHRLLANPPLRGVSGDWADEVRAECDDLRIAALTIDAHSSLETGDFERSISCAETLIGLDPLRERAYRLAMHGYLGLGDRAQAVEVAARCRRALSEELGIDPSPETQELLLHALRHNTATIPPTDSTSSHSTTTAAGVVPSVPRGDELGIIGAAWEKAATGVGQCVVVTGDAGMGKTTLVLEAVEQARELGFDVLFGRCTEDAIVAFEPFVEAAGRELDAMGPVRARQWLIENGADILRLIPHAARRYGDLVPTPTGDDRAQIVTAVYQWLTAASRSAPTIIVVDDVHWASDATHALLRYLVQASTGQPVCFIVTARTHALTDPHLNATLNTATRLGGVHRITLSEFTVADVEHLVDAHGSGLDPGELHRHTSGHPLFVSSLLGESFGEPASGPGGSYPASIVEFVRRAEHGIGDTARDLLRACAVIGVSSPKTLLRMVLGDVDDIRFADALDELLQSRVVTTTDTSIPAPSWNVSAVRWPAPVGDDDVELRHPLVQEVVYADISPGARAALHSKVGRALEELATQAAAEGAAPIAYHLSRGLPADQRRAGAYSHLAGDYALALGAYEDALAHYGHAVDRMPPEDDSVTHCRLLIGLGRARRATRDPGARAPALAAVAMARRLGDRHLQVEAVLASERRGMEFVQQYAVDIERVDIIDAICADMVREGHDSTAGFATLLSQLAIERAWDTEHHDRDRLITRAADIARDLGDGPLLARVGVAALIGLRVPHSAAIAESALQDLNDLAGSQPGAFRDVTTIVWVSRARLASGDLAGAGSALETITDAHIDGDPELDWLVKYGRLGVDLAAGRLVDAQEQLSRIRAIPPSPTDAGYYGRLLPALTALGTLRGDLGEIAAQSSFMRAHFDSIAVMRPALAVALLDVGDREGAAELVSWYTADRLADIPVDPMWLSTLTLIARAAAELGTASLCEQIYGHLSAHAACTVLTWASIYGVVHHHLAHLALGFGDLTRASYHIADAHEANTSRGFVGWASESDYLEMFIDCVATGSIDETRRAAVRSRAVGIGATAVVRRIDALTATISSSS